MSVKFDVTFGEASIDGIENTLLINVFTFSPYNVMISYRNIFRSRISYMWYYICDIRLNVTVDLFPIRL